MADPKIFTDMTSKHMGSGTSYVEAQYHGGLGVDDIEAVVLRIRDKTEPAIQAVVREAEKRNIPIEWIEYTGKYY